MFHPPHCSSSSSVLCLSPYLICFCFFNLCPSKWSYGLCVRVLPQWHWPKGTVRPFDYPKKIKEYHSAHDAVKRSWGSESSGSTFGNIIACLDTVCTSRPLSLTPVIFQWYNNLSEEAKRSCSRERSGVAATSKPVVWKQNLCILMVKSMWGSCRDFSGGDGTHAVEPERLNLKIFP